MALAADGRFLYISETVSIYLGLSQVSKLIVKHKHTHSDGLVIHFWPEADKKQYLYTFCIHGKWNSFETNPVKAYNSKDKQSSFGFRAKIYETQLINVYETMSLTLTTLNVNEKNNYYTQHRSSSTNTKEM